MRTLSHLRDFLDEEALKFMVGNLMTGQFILLKEHSRPKPKGKPGEEEKINDYGIDKAQKEVVRTFHTKIHVFDQGGTFIGTIENPDWYPEPR